MTDEPRSRGREVSSGSKYGRRTFIAVGSGVGAALLAGCTSDDPSGDGTPTDDAGDGSGGGETANFRLLVSDAPADIDDFDRLNVTFEKARVFEGGDEGEGTETTDDQATETDDEQGAETADDQTTETVEEDHQQTTDEGTATENGTETGNGTETENEIATATDAENGTATEEATETTEDSDDEGGRGFYELDLDSPTVDLTRVVGDRAQSVFDGELSAGSYQKLELHVAEIEGIVEGDEVEVQVPSDKLQLTKPFEVRAGEELDFVFDINVVRRGNQASYNLKPVISQSGVRDEDVDVEEVGEDGEGDGSEGGARANETDDEGGDGEAGGDETDGADEETGGNQSGGNESAA